MPTFIVWQPKRSSVTRTERHDVIVVGGGVAGLSAAIFTARQDLDTVVLTTGESRLRRNAHLENYPGFPAGVDARTLLEMMADQAERAGSAIEEAEVTQLDPEADLLAVTTDDETIRRSDAVVAATKNRVDYLEHLDDVEVVHRGTSFVDVDGRGRTGLEGLYVAGRLAGKPHQAIVAAGHGAEVAVTLLEDADRGFYHDWVVPTGYFTGRGRDVPPGCEAIDDEERLRRVDRATACMREYVDASHSEPPEQHPEVRTDR